MAVALTKKQQWKENDEWVVVGLKESKSVERGCIVVPDKTRNPRATVPERVDKVLPVRPLRGTRTNHLLRSRPSPTPPRRHACKRSEAKSSSVAAASPSRARSSPDPNRRWPGGSPHPPVDRENGIKYPNNARPRPFASLIPPAPPSRPHGAPVMANHPRHERRRKENVDAEEEDPNASED